MRGITGKETELEFVLRNMGEHPQAIGWPAQQDAR
jgi:hypothetical protein